MALKGPKEQLNNCFTLLLFLTSSFHGINSLPTVDPGVFVLQGVATCREGRGYCLLGLSCSIDKDFAKDDEGGHCDGLTKSFTSKISFVCCKYVNESKMKMDTYETTLSPFTLSDEKFQVLDENPIHVEGEDERILPDGVDPSSLIDIVGAVTDATGIVRLITKPYEVTTKSLKNDTNEETGGSTTPETVPEMPYLEELDENTENYNALHTDIEVKVNEEKSKLGEDEDLEVQLNIIKEESKEGGNKEIAKVPHSTTKNEETVNKHQQQILIPHHFLKPFAEDDTSPKVYNDISSYAQPVTVSTNLPIEVELKMREDIAMTPEATTETTQYGLMLPSDEEEERQKIVTTNKEDGGLLKPFIVRQKETSALFENNISEKKILPKIENEQQVSSAINVNYQPMSQNNLPNYKLKESTHLNEKPLEISIESLIVNSPSKIQQIINSEDDYIEESSLPHPVNLNICGIKKTYSQHRHLLRRTEPASVYEWCWSAALMKKVGGSSDKFECSGALIEHDLVVTSAACLKRLRKEDLSSYRIVLGDSNLRDDLPYGIQFHDISEIVTHPDYLTSGGSHANDIGLIRLKDYATISENVCLVCVAQKNSFIPNSSCVVSGYTGGDVPKIMRDSVSLAIPPEGTLRVARVDLEISAEDCTYSLLNMARSPLLLQNPETFLCDRQRKSFKCLDSFDGGSPLVCQAGGRWFLTGISSWSSDCNTEPNVYTKVSSHSDWIMATRLRMNGFASHKGMGEMELSRFS